MCRLVKNFACDSRAATMVEYGLAVAVIGLVVGAGAAVLGHEISTMFVAIGNALTSIPFPG